MKCTIPALHLRVFGKAVQSLAKIGDEISLEPTFDGLLLKSINSTRSCLAIYTLKPRFFQHYDDGSPRPVDQTAPRFRLMAKSILNVFRSLSGMDKLVEKCEIRLNESKTRIIFSLACKHGIVKTYSLTYMEAEPLSCTLSHSSSPSMMRAESKVYLEIINSFPSSLEELTLIASTQKVSIRNFVDQDSVKDPLKSLSTTMTLYEDEFESYRVNMDTSISFCLKEVKAALTFAEYSGVNVALYFDTAGKPMFVVMEGDPNFDATFITSTISESQEANTSCPSSTEAHQMASGSSSTHHRAREATPQPGPSTSHIIEDNVSAVEVKPKRISDSKMDDLSISLLPTNSVNEVRRNVDALLEEIDMEISVGKSSAKKAKSILFGNKSLKSKSKTATEILDDVLAGDSEDDA